MYILPSAEGGIFLSFKGEKKHIKHYILWYELFALHRYRGYPDFKVLILFLPESTEASQQGQQQRWTMKMSQIAQKNGKNGTNIGQIEQISALFER